MIVTLRVIIPPAPLMLYWRYSNGSCFPVSCWQMYCLAIDVFKCRKPLKIYIDEQ